MKKLETLNPNSRLREFPAGTHNEIVRVVDEVRRSPMFRRRALPLETGAAVEAADGPLGSLDQQFYPYLKARAINASDKTAKRHETRWVEMARGLDRGEYYKRWDAEYAAPRVPAVELIDAKQIEFEKQVHPTEPTWTVLVPQDLTMSAAIAGDTFVWVGAKPSDWTGNDADGWTDPAGNVWGTANRSATIVEPRALGSETSPNFQSAAWGGSVYQPAVYYLQTSESVSATFPIALPDDLGYTNAPIVLHLRGHEANYPSGGVATIKVASHRELQSVNYLIASPFENWTEHYNRTPGGVADWDGLNPDPVSYGVTFSGGGMALAVDLHWQYENQTSAASMVYDQISWTEGDDPGSRYSFNQVLSETSPSDILNHNLISGSVAATRITSGATHLSPQPEGTSVDIDTRVSSVSGFKNRSQGAVTLIFTPAPTGGEGVPGGEQTTPSTTLPDKLVVSLPGPSVTVFDDDKATARRVFRQRFDAQPAIALEQIGPGQEGWFAFEGYAWALVYLHDWRHRWAGYPKSSTRERTLATPDQLEIGSSGVHVTGYVGPRNRKGGNPAGLKDYLPRPDFLYSTSGPNVARIVWAPGDDPSLIYSENLSQTLTATIDVVSEAATIDTIASVRNLEGTPPSLAYTLSEGDRKATGDIRQQWPAPIVPSFLPTTVVGDYGTWTLNEFYQWTYTLNEASFAGESDGSVEDAVTFTSFVDVDGEGEPTRQYGVYSPFVLLDPESATWPEPWVTEVYTDDDDGSLQSSVAATDAAYIEHDYGFDPARGRVPGSVEAKQDDDYRAGFRLCLVRLDGQPTGGDCC